MPPEEPRAIVTIQTTAREPIGEPRAYERRTYDLVLNWPASPLGEADEAIATALRAADAAGMMHDGVYRIDATVEWEPLDG